MKNDHLDLTAPIFNIQSYSIHDGPGIRVTVFMKGCPLRCLWCANPESHLSSPQLMTYANKCTLCGSCTGACPHGCIELSEKDGMPFIKTDRTLCRNCGACVDVCPADARELAGEHMSVRQVLNEINKDRLFLDSSGGGMTLSGGEPLMHPDFAEALLKASKEDGLHTAIESSVFAPREVIDRAFRYVDLGLLDIKHMDSDEHKRLTGVPNELILDNLRHIYHDLKVPFMVSIPTIPGYNDFDENIAATARFIAGELGTDVPVRLLGYHRLGEGKKAALGADMNLSIEAPDDRHMQRLKEIVESYGLTAQIGG